jgi:hypothetical protein
VFAAVLSVHFFWLTNATAQTGWLSVDDDTSLFRAYLKSGAIWLGLSYALALSFAAWWLDRYREERFCVARTLSIGGMTLSGFLAVAGCYAVGCCGSPMLTVYLTLFGAAFLPFTKPLIFLFTATSLGATSWWVHRRRPGAGAPLRPDPCDSPWDGRG